EAASAFRRRDVRYAIECSPARPAALALRATRAMNALAMQWLALLPEAVRDHLPSLALAAALAWGAGLRLYLVIFVFGLLGRLGWWPLPENLEVLAHPVVLAASGFMSVVELA